MTARPTAILTESNVMEILDRLQGGIPHRLIAAEFGVSKKTISRINTGETWRDVSLRFGARPPAQLGSLHLVGLPTEFCDLHDEITAIKNHFALSFQQPIYWGWFESWDGLHALVSDGYIVWESADLVKYARKIAATEIKGIPVWAEKLDELPTFELEALMTCPIGEPYKVDICGGDIARLIGTKGTVIIRQKYVNVAAKMKLEIREAGDRLDIVYLTRNKPKSKRDPMPFVIACCSTMQEV
jgi:hypothetical protein